MMRTLMRSQWMSRKTKERMIKATVAYVFTWVFKKDQQRGEQKT